MLNSCSMLSELDMSIKGIKAGKEVRSLSFAFLIVHSKEEKAKLDQT